MDNANLQAQFRNIAIGLVIVVILGTLGFMLIEEMRFFDAFYLTVITLATVGYGDLTAQTDLGRLFTIFIIFLGFSIFAFVAQSFFSMLVNPESRAARQRKRTQKHILQLDNHYVICGQGELVEKLSASIVQGSDVRHQHFRSHQLKQFEARYPRLMERLVQTPLGRKGALKLINLYLHYFHPIPAFKNIVVVLTQDEKLATRLSNQGAYVVLGDGTEDEAWRRCGVDRARALIITLDSDSQTLLAVLSARSLAPRAFISASIISDDIALKIIRAGANTLLTPFDAAGQFLNNSTLRPTVSDFLSRMLFVDRFNSWGTELRLLPNAPWIGKTLAEANPRQYGFYVFAIQRNDGRYAFNPAPEYVLEEDEILIGVIDMVEMESLTRASGGTTRQDLSDWQQLSFDAIKPAHRPMRTPEQLTEALQDANKHFIIGGNDAVIRKALLRLNPARAFVVVTDEPKLAEAVNQRGFLLVRGKVMHDEVLIQAGIQRAQALMLSYEDRAEAVYSVFQARALNRHVYIVATAYSDDMLDKLRRAGADRVFNPYQVAAQFILMATTRPAVRQFVQATLYNPMTQLETTELYLEDKSTWIGQSLADLRLHERFEAVVLGIQRQGQDQFIYMPVADMRLEAYDVLVLLTPMRFADVLRIEAHATQDKRPTQLTILPRTMPTT